MLTRLDSAILDRIEAITHSIQKQTGWNCFHLLRGVVAIYAAFVVFDMAKVASYFKAFTATVGIDACLLFTALLAILFPTGQAGISTERTANPKRYSTVCRAFRLFSLLAVVSAIAAHLLGHENSQLPHISNVRAPLIALWVYLDACTPLPPCIGRIWEALRASRLAPAASRV